MKSVGKSAFHAPPPPPPPPPCDGVVAISAGLAPELQRVFTWAVAGASAGAGRIPRNQSRSNQSLLELDLIASFPIDFAGHVIALMSIIRQDCNFFFFFF